MERLNIRLTKTEHVKPYECHEILPKGEGCVTAEFSPCGEYLIVGCNNYSQVLLYSFLSHGIVLRFRPAKPVGKVLNVK